MRNDFTIRISIPTHGTGGHQINHKHDHAFSGIHGASEHFHWNAIYLLEKPFFTYASCFTHVLMHIYLSGNRVRLSIRSPKNKTFISHVEDVTLPKSIREVHGLLLGTICVENHVQILSNKWIVLEV